MEIHIVGINNFGRVVWKIEFEIKLKSMNVGNFEAKLKSPGSWKGKFPTAAKLSNFGEDFQLQKKLTNFRLLDEKISFFQTALLYRN